MELRTGRRKPYQGFDTETDLIQVTGLNSNTTYTVKLICNYTYVENNTIIETRTSEFEVTTEEYDRFLLF